VLQWPPVEFRRRLPFADWQYYLPTTKGGASSMPPVCTRPPYARQVTITQHSIFCYEIRTTSSAREVDVDRVEGYSCSLAVALALTLNFDFRLEFDLDSGCPISRVFCEKWGFNPARRIFPERPALNSTHVPFPEASYRVSVLRFARTRIYFLLPKIYSGPRGFVAAEITAASHFMNLT
jgi:hypothetical protein